jgi:hypothetical protein
MATGVEGGLDLREFQEALRQCAAKTSRELPVFLNSKGYHIVKRAHILTREAKRADIENELRIQGYRVSKSRKTGQFKRRNVIAGQDSLAARIVNARRRRAGEYGLRGEKLEEAARKLVMRRIRGIGSQKAGWIGILKTLASRLGIAMSTKGPKVKGRGKAIPAKSGWSPSLEIIYDLNSYNTNHRAYIDPQTEAALQEGFNMEAQSMREHLAKKLQPIFDQHKGRPK